MHCRSIISIFDNVFNIAEEARVTRVTGRSHSNTVAVTPPQRVRKSLDRKKKRNAGRPKRHSVAHAPAIKVIYSHQVQDRLMVCCPGPGCLILLRFVLGGDVHRSEVPPIFVIWCLAVRAILWPTRKATARARVKAAGARPIWWTKSTVSKWKATRNNIRCVCSRTKSRKTKRRADFQTEAHERTCCWVCICQLHHRIGWRLIDAHADDGMERR